MKIIHSLFINNGKHYLLYLIEYNNAGRCVLRTVYIELSAPILDQI